MQQGNYCRLIISTKPALLDLDGAMHAVESIKDLPETLPRKGILSGRFKIIEKGFVGAFFNRKQKKQITIIELPKGEN